jgi:hypothetical protein
VARLPLFANLPPRALQAHAAEALDQGPMRPLALMLMPNPWPFVLWPEHDDELRAFSVG